MQIGAAKPADGSAGRDGYRRRGETDGGGNARRLGIDPAFDQKVMTALMSDDIIDSSTGKYASMEATAIWTSSESWKVSPACSCII